MPASGHLLRFSTVFRILPAFRLFSVWSQRYQKIRFSMFSNILLSSSLWSWECFKTLFVLELAEFILITIRRVCHKEWLGVFCDCNCLSLAFMLYFIGEYICHYVRSPGRTRYDGSAFKGTSFHCPSEFMITLHPAVSLNAIQHVLIFEVEST